MGENGEDDVTDDWSGMMIGVWSDWSGNVEGLFVYGHSWWMESDFQTKLCLVLVSWLLLNLCLIWVCWRKYGDNLSQMLMKEESSMKETLDGKIGMQTEDPLHYKYHPSQGEKIHRD